MGLQGCLRGPGVPPPPAEPRPFPGSRCLSPRPARGPPREPLAEPRGEQGAIRAPALAARSPQVANRSVRRTPQLKFPQATTFSAARPSPRPASAQDLRRPQAPPSALSSGSLARGRLRLRGPRTPELHYLKPALREQGWVERASQTRAGRGKGEQAKRAASPALRSLSPPRVWLISPAPPVAVIYLGVCARVVLGQPVGAQKTATSKR